MQIFDFNIHLPYLQSTDVNDVIRQDMSLDIQDVIHGLDVHQETIKGIAGANFLLFNTALFDEPGSVSLKDHLFSAVQSFFITNLIDFRRSDIGEYLEKAKACGLRAIMFNSYLQQIAETDFELVLKACKLAEQLGLIICIDGSYGTSKMYTYENMRLACLAADHITRTKIIIVHSGGYNIMNAMLLAAAKPNVWLDTSFSLPYYIGSSIEIDFAFAYRKLDFQRVVFGSDHPYMDLAHTVDVHMNFFKKFDFPAKAIEDIMFNNAASLFHDT